MTKKIIEISESLYNVAEGSGKMNGVSAAEQIELWAQVGRILLPNSVVSSELICSVRNGDVSIDDIPKSVRAQAAKALLEEAIFSPNKRALHERTKIYGTTTYSIEEDGVIKANKPKH